MIVINGQVNAPAVAALARSTPSRLPRSFVFHVERVMLDFEPSIVAMMLKAFRVNGVCATVQNAENKKGQIERNELQMRSYIANCFGR
jgi:hypothetical protein